MDLPVSVNDVVGGLSILAVASALLLKQAVEMALDTYKKRRRRLSGYDR